MESSYKFTTRRLLTFMAISFLAVALSGCMDSMVADMEAERQEVGFMVEQELQRCRSLVASQSSKSRTLPPAQAADMETERRELDRMVEQGRWSTLSSGPQAEAFHPAP